MAKGQGYGGNVKGRRILAGLACEDREETCMMLLQPGS